MLLLQEVNVYAMQIQKVFREQFKLTCNLQCCGSSTAPFLAPTEDLRLSYTALPVLEKILPGHKPFPAVEKLKIRLRRFEISNRLSKVSQIQFRIQSGS
jgi:hypothetical protein